MTTSKHIDKAGKMSCHYCGKSSCRHAHCVHREETAHASVPVSAPSARCLSGALFEIIDPHRARRCVLCDLTIPAGPSQRMLLTQHGNSHVNAGDAKAIRSGLRDGLIHFEIIRHSSP